MTNYPDPDRYALAFPHVRQGDENYAETLQRSRAASLRGEKFWCYCDYDGPQWNGLMRCAHCGGQLFAEIPDAGTRHEPQPVDAVREAAHALGVLAADVETGGVRLTHYPRVLPSLDELVAAVEAIETSPTLTHDQLSAFARIAGEASVGSLRDGRGAIGSLSLTLRPDLSAAVAVDGGEVVARIMGDGTTTYTEL